MISNKKSQILWDPQLRRTRRRARTREKGKGKGKPNQRIGLSVREKKIGRRYMAVPRKTA